MSKEQQIRELTEHFCAFGAQAPEAWARSQVEENIPQYVRFVFLRQAWLSVIGDGDTSWIPERADRAVQ